jgi:hypothetical protein
VVTAPVSWSLHAATRNATCKTRAAIGRRALTAPLFCIASTQEHIDDPCQLVHGHPNCMYELSMALTTIFVSRILVGNATEVAVPWVKRLIKRRMETRREAKDGLSKAALRPGKAEEQFYMEKYDDKNTFDEYAEMIVQVSTAKGEARRVAMPWCSLLHRGAGPLVAVAVPTCTPAHSGSRRLPPQCRSAATPSSPFSLHGLALPPDPPHP